VTPLSLRVLDACLRRVRAPQWEARDLVLVRAHPVLAGLPPVGDLLGGRWPIAQVTGELTLRDALPETGPLVAVVPPGFAPPPDIGGRAWLNKALHVRADDIVSGVTGRPCEPLPDEELAEAVEGSVDLLAAQVGRWSQHGTVTAAEVRAVLVAADLGTDDRFDRERDHHLLTRWILQGAPRSRVPALLARALEESIPRTGRWLAWAARTGDVPGLLAAGAVGPEPGGGWAVEPAPRTAAERQDLATLVDRAVRDAWAVDAARTAAALQPAERLGHRVHELEAEPGRFPLLRAALDRALHRFARDAADGNPAEDAAVDRLRANLHGPGATEWVEHVKDLGRIARALRRAPPTAGVDTWVAFAVDTVAWLDLALRSTRRRLERAPADLRGPTEALLAAARAHRDAWNRAFAGQLAAEWPRVSASKDLRRPLPLHQVTRSLVARLIDDGARVFLVVLDGCDLSTFLELMQPGPDGVGLALPPVTDGLLRDDLAAGGPLRVAVAPVPTVTSHARRALFAGEIPGNSALDETESPSANASGDNAALSRNQALKDVPRQLLLKGQLADGAVEAALARADLRLLSVVWNGVDDALSSKETTALGPWTPGALGVRAEAALQRAVDLGWTVVLTADHGHTPHWEPGKKVAPAALGARYHTEPLPGAVRFDAGPLPTSPLHLLTDVGAWAGGQRRGYHGGAALEEVLVPLALLGPGGGRPRHPAWWWSREDVVVELHEPSPPPRAAPAAPAPPAPAGARGLPAELRAALEGQPAWTGALERLAEREVLSLAQLAALLGRPPFLVGGMMSSILATVGRAGLPAPFDEVQTAEERTYRWRRS
jgi:hypothetical protein